MTILKKVLVPYYDKKVHSHIISVVGHVKKNRYYIYIIIIIHVQQVV